ncbi:MAG: DUF262 domain-containing protein [Bacteroidales bacterium]|nr:DUF262 domain-containing protein [Bacteroidales bacterium]
MNINEHTFQDLFGENTNAKGETYTIDKIEIPIIQRDYAQGRNSNEAKRIRERFLDSILDAVRSHRHITLDFVYGEIEKDEEGKSKLTPLDGQQRLTTLFLLHWYASRKEGIKKEKSAFLKNFTYYTRPSSRDFCEKLTEFCPDFNEMLSENIKNQPWFQYHWLNDPTIKGMLVMIDAIHEKFGNEKKIWQALVDDKLVTFYFMPVDEMGLTDDLYVKMNSRGKPLTPFEHFKAEFEGIISQSSADLSKEFNRKFDIDWSDMLFPYRGDNNIIDDEFMRYFFFISDILCYQQGKPLEKDEFKLATILYGKENPNAITNLNYLKNAFDCWCGFDIEVFFGDVFSAHQYQAGKTKIFQDNLNIFKQCCEDYGEYIGRNRKFPLNMTLLLYAVVVYLQNKTQVSFEDFKHRIRIVRNLIWNSRDEIRADAQRNNMQLLLLETKEIILKGDVPQAGAYNQRQKEEERAKQSWLSEHPQYKEELFHLEDHRLLYGCIAIVGLDNPENFGKFRILFNNPDRKLVSRLLLTVGDYSQKLDNWRWQIMGRNDSSLTDLFHPSNHRKGFERTKEIVNGLLYNINDFSDNALERKVEDYLENPETPKDWRFYFVKYPIMLSDTYGMFTSWNNDDARCTSETTGYYQIYKMNTSERLSGFHWNVFLLAINETLAEKYSLDGYGGKLVLSDDLAFDCKNDKFAFYKKDEANANWITSKKYPIPIHEGADARDRVEHGAELIRKTIG